MLSGLPGIIFFCLYMRTMKNISGIIFFIILVSFLGDSLGYFYAKYIYPNNYPVINIWHITDLILVSLYFLFLKHIRRNLILSLSILFMTTATISFNFFSILESNTFVWVFSNIIIIVYCILSYLGLLQNSHYDIYKLPVFWVITGLLIFNSVTLLSFLFLQYLVFELQIALNDHGVIYLIIQLSNILKNILLFYALLLIYKGHPESFLKARTS